MDLRATPNLVHLSDSAAGVRSLHLAPARGYRVVAICGEVWITQAGHVEDYVLQAGDELTLKTEGSAIVSAFGSADVEVIAPAAAPPIGGYPEISATTLERAQREAHRLRAEAMQDMFSAASAWVRRLAQRLTSVAARSVP